MNLTVLLNSYRHFSLVGRALCYQPKDWKFKSRLKSSYGWVLDPDPITVGSRGAVWWRTLHSDSNFHTSWLCKERLLLYCICVITSVFYFILWDNLDSITASQKTGSPTSIPVYTFLHWHSLADTNQLTKFTATTCYLASAHFSTLSEPCSYFDWFRRVIAGWITTAKSPCVYGTADPRSPVPLNSLLIPTTTWWDKVHPSLCIWPASPKARGLLGSWGELHQRKGAEKKERSNYVQSLSSEDLPPSLTHHQHRYPTHPGSLLRPWSGDWTPAIWSQRTRNVWEEYDFSRFPCWEKEEN